MFDSTMKVCRVRDVKLPNKAHKIDAGFDFFIPNDFTPTVLEPGKDICIPSGVKVIVPHGYALIAKNKSGVATKKKLRTGACVAPDTNIKTNKGVFQAKCLTNDFVRSNNILVETYNQESKNFEYSEFDGFRCTGTKNTITLTFDDGTELVCASDHRILTNNGWKTAEDITEEDELIVNDLK